MKYSNQKYVYAFTDLGFFVCFCLSLLPVIFQHQASNILILILFMSWQLSLSRLLIAEVKIQDNIFHGMHSFLTVFTFSVT